VGGGSMFKLAANTRTATFFDLYSRGAVAAEAIEDWVERWHQGQDPAAVGRDLHDYLGLSLPEYQVWVYDPDALPVLLDARRQERALEAAVRDRLAALEASVPPTDGMVLRGLRTWLAGRTREAATAVPLG